jgi:hypothetical protein
MLQYGYQRHRDECGDESVFDRSRGSFVAKEIFAFSSHVHLLFLALSNLRGRLIQFASTLDEDFEFMLNASVESPAFCRVSIATVKKTLVGRVIQNEDPLRL